jgi:hypothetical protein
MASRLVKQRAQGTDAIEFTVAGLAKMAWPNFTHQLQYF